MTVEMSIPFTAGRAAAWTWLTMIDRVLACVPGARLETSGDGQSVVVVRAKLGSAARVYRLTAQRIDDANAAFRSEFRIRAEALDGRCRTTATAKITLVPAGASAGSPGGSDLRIAVAAITTDSTSPQQTELLNDVLHRLHRQFAERAEEAMSMDAATADQVDDASILGLGGPAPPPREQGTSRRETGRHPAGIARRPVTARQRRVTWSFALAGGASAAAVMLWRAARKDARS